MVLNFIQNFLLHFYVHSFATTIPVAMYKVEVLQGFIDTGSYNPAM